MENSRGTVKYSQRTVKNRLMLGGKNIQHRSQGYTHSPTIYLTDWSLVCKHQLKENRVSSDCYRRSFIWKVDCSWKYVQCLSPAEWNSWLVLSVSAPNLVGFGASESASDSVFWLLTSIFLVSFELFLLWYSEDLIPAVESCIICVSVGVTKTIQFISF